MYVNYLKTDLDGLLLQPDPIWPLSGLNAYTGMKNNPLRFVDPLGLAAGDPYATNEQAGYQAINDVNAASIVLGQEFAGTTYQNPNGTYSYTAPNGGTLAGSSHGPINSNTTGLYHTHGANDPGYANEYYSPLDQSNAINLGIPSYLGTPSGKTFSIDPSTGQIRTLGPSSQANSCGR